MSFFPCPSSLSPILNQYLLGSPATEVQSSATTSGLVNSSTANSPNYPSNTVLYDNFAPTTHNPVFGAEETTLDPFLAMPTFQSMNSASLVAAALGPPSSRPQSTTPKSHSNSHAKYPASSSSFSELSEPKLSNETERCTRRTKSTKDVQSLTSQHDAKASLNDRGGRTRPKRSRSPKENVEIRDPDLSYNVETVSSDDQTPVEQQISAPAQANVRRSKRRMVRKKPHGVRVPQTLDAAGASDRMMWEWKNMGKTWQQIRDEWQRITGVRPGMSTLSVRYLKMNENFALQGAAGDRELLRFKREADEEFKDQIWDRVAEKMLAFNIMSEHNPRDLKKRHDYIIRAGTQRSEIEEDKHVTSDVEVKDESEDEVQKSKIVTLSLPKSYGAADGHPNDFNRGPSLDRTSRTGFEQETQPYFKDGQPFFNAPFAYNYMAPSLLESQTISVSAEEVTPGRAATTISAAATPRGRKRTRRGELVSYDGGYHKPNQPESSPMRTLVTSSSPLPLASSPFLKTLVAYDSEDE